jgi:hypothetical protein
VLYFIESRRPVECSTLDKLLLIGHLQVTHLPLPHHGQISDREDSLAGYDMFFAISEEAINAQLEKLYSTLIDTGRLPPPSRVKNFKPMPATAHLINHKFFLHVLNQKNSIETGKEVYCWTASMASSRVRRFALGPQ